MDIELLAAPEENIVGWEVQFGEREGIFFVLSNGTVTYRHPDGTNDWTAGSTVQQFREAAEAWNRYCNAARVPEFEHPGVVAQLKADLDRIGVLTVDPYALWPVFLEQAEDGLL
jgi:hypothetical protein